MHDPNQKPVLVSACLCGRPCRYDGRDAAAGDKLKQRLAELGAVAVPFCPEVEGGLSTPRPPAWIETHSAAAVLAGEDRIVTEGGVDVTHAFRRGAEATLELCQSLGIEHALLKERSPSCGVAQTHVDGSPGPGSGVTAALLAQNGIETEGI
jgi:uncharacterized protein YbbK (DUF523 family)